MAGPPTSFIFFFLAVSIAAIAGCSPGPQARSDKPEAPQATISEDSVPHALKELTPEELEQKQLRGKSYREWIDQINRGAKSSRNFAILLIIQRFDAPAKKAAVPALVVALKDGDKDIRMMAVKALASAGPGAREAAPSLVEALDDHEIEVAVWAATALCQIGQRDVAIPTLVHALKHPNSKAHQKAANTLSGMRFEVAPQVLRVLGMGPDPEDALKDLEQLLAEGDKYVRFQATVALEIIGPEVLSSLVRLLEDENNNVRIGVAQAIGKMGHKAKDSIPYLINIARNRKDLKPTLTMTLKEIGADSMPPLIELLGDRDVSIRVWACRTLGVIGPEASAAIPPLLEIVADQDAPSTVRQESLVALSRIIRRINDNSKTIPVLAQALHDEDRRIRENAGHILSTIGLDAVPALMAALESDRAHIRIVAIGSLSKMGRDALPALELIIEILNDSNGQIRGLAAETIRAMGPVAREAVPALIEALKDDDWEVRHMVIDALGKIGPGAQEALGELARILDDEKEIPALRASARKATENILKE